MPSKPKKEPRQSKSARAYFRIYGDGKELIVDKRITSSTSEAKKFTVLVVPGKVQGDRQIFLIGLHPMLSDTPERQR